MVDFETNSNPDHPTNDVYLFEKLEILPPYKNYTLGLSVRELLDTVDKGGWNEIWYFHNLNFDGWFMLEPIIKKGYQPINIGDKPCKGSFQLFMSDRNSIFCIKIYGQINTITIIDSYKILCSSVSNLGEKLDLDYNQYRKYKNIKDVSYETLKYLHQDCKTVAEYLFQFKSPKWTAGGYAINNLEEAVDSDIWKENFEPELKKELIHIARKSYKGGFTNFNENYRNKKQDVWGYDINSSYPYAMTQPLPCGVPTHYKTKPVYQPKRLYLIRVFIRNAKLKAEAPCPLIMKPSGIWGGSHFWNEISMMSFYVWIGEFKYWKLFYDIDYTITDWYEFETSLVVKNWITNLYSNRKEAKLSGDKVKDHLLKITMNSSYGKLAERSVHFSKYIDKCDGRCFNHMNWNGYCLYVKEDEATKQRNVFTASYITSFARSRLFEIINTIKDDFVYCDTDSIYSKKELNMIDINPTKLGAWKHEYTGAFMFLKQKCYITYDKLVIAGCGQNCKEAIWSIVNKDWTKFKTGLKIPEGNIKAKRTKTGIILQPYDFEIT